MEQAFNIHLTLLNKTALVKKAPYFLTIIREGFFSVSVDRLPLIEYFVLIDHDDRKQQIKSKVYKTVSDGRWYDAGYGEEAETNSPEFGIPEINQQIKVAIAHYEMNEVAAENTSLKHG